MTLFIAAGAIVGGKRYLAVQSGFLRRGQYLRVWRAMWVIIDYKSQFEAEMTGGKKRWGNNPRLQYEEVAVAAAAPLCVCPHKWWTIYIGENIDSRDIKPF